MAKEQSVAPKERVNIRFKPATGDAKEQVELPLRMMVLGDFTGRSEETPLEDRKPVAVNKDNFQDVMRAMELQADLSVPNRLVAGTDSRTAVHLEFQTLKDFEPESVARQVPELRELLELRAALVALKGPLGNIDAFKKKLQAILADDKQRDRVIKEVLRDEKDGE